MRRNVARGVTEESRDEQHDFKQLVPVLLG
jgi:hypothetical protein